MYTAVFRTNKGDKYKDKFACRVGSRTDFHVNKIGSPESIWIPKKVEDLLNGVKSQWERLKSVLKRRSPREWKALIPTSEATSRGTGSGSGSSAYALALTLCRHIDMFGYGIFSDGGNDVRYAHFYDPVAQWPKSGHSIVESELRNAFFDAVGIWNYIWW